MKLLGAGEFILNKLLSLSHLSPSPSQALVLIMTNPTHVFTMSASNEGRLKGNSSRQLLSTMAEERHHCLPVKNLSFTLGLDIKKKTSSLILLRGRIGRWVQGYREMLI